MRHRDSVGLPSAEEIRLRILWLVLKQAVTGLKTSSRNSEKSQQKLLKPANCDFKRTSRRLPVATGVAEGNV